MMNKFFRRLETAHSSAEISFYKNNSASHTMLDMCINARSVILRDVYKLIFEIVGIKEFKTADCV